MYVCMYVCTMNECIFTCLYIYMYVCMFVNMCLFLPQWWVDPVGCILISLIICHRWIAIMKDQMEKVTGLSAPEEFLRSIQDSIFQHDSVNIRGVDRVIAYFSGAKYNVEVDILVPKTLTVDVAHDIALGVQNMLEDMADVDRAYVHVSGT